MAEMNNMERSSTGRRYARKASTRVDLTAMVDLGFLLITFFMLASVFGKPKVLEVNKPAESDEIMDDFFVKKSKTFTILAGKNDKVYCYVGADDETGVKVDSLPFSYQAIRKRIMARQQEVKELWGHPDELFVSIKLFPKSKYQNMVDLLDEMRICSVKRYAIIDELNKTDKRIALLSGNELQ